MRKLLSIGAWYAALITIVTLCAFAFASAIPAKTGHAAAIQRAIRDQRIAPIIIIGASQARDISLPNAANWAIGGSFPAEHMRFIRRIPSDVLVIYSITAFDLVNAHEPVRFWAYNRLTAALETCRCWIKRGRAQKANSISEWLTLETKYDVGIFRRIAETHPNTIFVLSPFCGDSAKEDWLVAAMNASGLHVLDFADSMPPEYFRDEIHLSVHGYKALSNLIETNLKQSYLSPST